MSFEKIKPALILAAIAAVVSALVIITYNVTYVDTSGILTEKQAAAVVSVYGGAAAEYSVVSKLVLSVAMLLGRLEIIPILIAVSPSTWLKR